MLYFGNWCCERYYDCAGYKLKLSDKAKKRGNNGVRGTLSKISIPDNINPRDRIEFKLICSSYKKEFIKNSYI